MYLVREQENKQELLDFVIKETDHARNDFNSDGTDIIHKEETVNVSCVIKDSMKDLKFKRMISGLGGAVCLLCKSKVNWTGLILRRSEKDLRLIDQQQTHMKSSCL